MRVQVKIFAALIMNLVLAHAMAAGPKQVRPTCPEAPIRVGFFEFGVLFNAERGTGRGFGLDRDLALELEKRSGCKFEGALMSRARIWVEMREGRLDMTLSALKTPDREAMAWMFPYARGEQVPLLSATVAPAERNEKSFMANRNLKFGVVRGFRHHPYYDALIEQLRAEDRVVEAVDEAQLISMLKRGAVHATVSLSTVYSRYLEPKEIGRDVFVERWNSQLEPVVGNVMLSRKTFNADEAEKWHALLNGMREDGTMLAIAMRYLGKDEARKLVWTK